MSGAISMETRRVSAARRAAAFKVTGTEAEVFGTQFRQFFIVG
jgi:hypothetical protein